MSSTNRGAVRATNDAYYTPEALARACVATIAADIRGETVWEPHAGGGAFVRAIRDAGARRVVATDIDPAAPCHQIPTDTMRYGPPVQDFLLATSPPGCAWIVGNPPWGDAEAHVRRALKLAGVGVAFLLRLAFLESRARAPFWRQYPPAGVHVLTERPSFTGNGQTDSAAYGWFVWRAAPTGLPRLAWISWKAGR